MEILIYLYDLLKYVGFGFLVTVLLVSCYDSLDASLKGVTLIFLTVLYIFTYSGIIDFPVFNF